MIVIRKVAAMRHFVALSMLAVLLSIFSASAGRVAAQPHRRGGDPVIGSMTWEGVPGGDSSTLADGVCDQGCTDNNCQKNGTCPNPGCNVVGLCDPTCIPDPSCNEPIAGCNDLNTIPLCNYA